MIIITIVKLIYLLIVIKAITSNLDSKFKKNPLFSQQVPLLVLVLILVAPKIKIIFLVIACYYDYSFKIIYYYTSLLYVLLYLFVM